ncbi:MAG: ribosome-binding factor A [Bacteroidales bacterium]|nr:ribosome-binding factor A [Bacteroidales bacterium]
MRKKKTMPRHHNSTHPVANVDRIARINELLKRVISEKLELLGFNENGLIVSIPRVHCCASLKNATVYVSVLGADNEDKKNEIINRILKKRIELQTLIAKEVILKYTPVFHFVLDNSVEEGDRVLDIIKKMEMENSDAQS